jgi:hypothetical protein
MHCPVSALYLDPTPSDQPFVVCRRSWLKHRKWDSRRTNDFRNAQHADGARGANLLCRAASPASAGTLERRFYVRRRRQDGAWRWGGRVIAPSCSKPLAAHTATLDGRVLRRRAAGAANPHASPLQPGSAHGSAGSDRRAVSGCGDGGARFSRQSASCVRALPAPARRGAGGRRGPPSLPRHLPRHRAERSARRGTRTVSICRSGVVRNWLRV